MADNIRDLAGLGEPKPTETTESEQPVDNPIVSAQTSTTAEASVADSSTQPSETTTVPTEDTAPPASSDASNNPEPTEEAAPVTEEPVNETPAKSAVLAALMGVIAPVGSVAAKPPLKMMLYSDPGAGKTTLMGQIPNNLIIDTEKGRLTLEENRKHKPELSAENVNILPYKSFEGLEMTIHEFANNPAELAHIETLTIDTVNNLHKRGLADVTEREWQRNPMANRYTAETEHHTENNEHIRRLIQSLVDLDRNIMLMAHSRTIEPKGKPAKTFPDFSEKLANTLAGMVDVVGYMYMTELDGEPTRVIRFQPTMGIVAKSRIASLPDNMINPTWADIWEAYNS